MIKIYVNYRNFFYNEDSKNLFHDSEMTKQVDMNVFTYVAFEDFLSQIDIKNRILFLKKEIKNVDLRPVAELSKKVKDLYTACKRRGLTHEYNLYTFLKAERFKANNKKVSEREMLHAKFVKEANKIAKHLPQPMYAMGDFIEVIVGEKHIIRGVFSDREEYAGTKYKAKYGYLKLSLTYSEFKNILVIGGLVTILKEKISPQIYKVAWYSKQHSKHNFQLTKINGWLIKGFHVQDNGQGFESAMAYVKTKRNNVAIAKWNDRASEELNRIANEIPLNRVFVSVQDSLNAGNCEAGTKNYAERKGINLSEIGAVRADWLLENKNGSEYYINKAIQGARIRYAKSIILH